MVMVTGSLGVWVARVGLAVGVGIGICRVDS